MSEQSEQNKRFEKAKAEFIKKLNGRDLAEYANDEERAESSRIEKNRTPEYNKMWADIDKRVAESGNEKKYNWCRIAP